MKNVCAVIVSFLCPQDFESMKHFKQELIEYEEENGTGENEFPLTPI